MSPASLLERPSPPHETDATGWSDGGEPGWADREPSLDALVSSAWEGLTAHRVVACPVCHGALEARCGTGAVPVAGRCLDCGAELS